MEQSRKIRNCLEALEEAFADHHEYCAEKVREIEQEFNSIPDKSDSKKEALAVEHYRNKFETAEREIRNLTYSLECEKYHSQALRDHIEEQDKSLLDSESELIIQKQEVNRLRQELVILTYEHRSRRFL